MGAMRMDFIDEIKLFSNRVIKLKDAINTEEATKNALILPFFQLLGYDVFNPLEFVPEFVADVGTKKQEKVDYAIVVDGNPVILIEAKWCGEALDKHDSQLFRYFGTTPAKFGILTNGIMYKFYTDLNVPNRMDLEPFMQFDLLDIQENLLLEIKRFSKNSLNIDDAINAASELKYTNLIKSLLQKQRTAPTDDFVKYVLGEIYDGRQTAQTLEKFKPIIKRGVNQYIAEAINETLKSAMKTNDESDSIITQVVITPTEETPQGKIITTDEELEAFGIIKGLLCEIIDPKHITYRDTESYFSIIIDDKVTKWICRLILNGKKKVLIIPPQVEPPIGKETKYALESIDDLYSLKDILLLSVKRFIEIEPKE